MPQPAMLLAISWQARNRTKIIKVVPRTAGLNFRAMSLPVASYSYIRRVEKSTRILCLPGHDFIDLKHDYLLQN